MSSSSLQRKHGLLLTKPCPPDRRTRVFFPCQHTREANSRTLLTQREYTILSREKEATSKALCSALREADGAVAPLAEELRQLGRKLDLEQARAHKAETAQRRERAAAVLGGAARRAVWGRRLARSCSDQVRGLARPCYSQLRPNLPPVYPVYV